MRRTTHRRSIQTFYSQRLDDGWPIVVWCGVFRMRWRIPGKIKTSHRLDDDFALPKSVNIFVITSRWTHQKRSSLICIHTTHIEISLIWSLWFVCAVAIPLVCFWLRIRGFGEFNASSNIMPFFSFHIKFTFIYKLERCWWSWWWWWGENWRKTERNKYTYDQSVIPCEMFAADLLSKNVLCAWESPI